MTCPVNLELTDTPSSDAVARIGQRLDDFNTEITGIADRRPLAVLVRGPLNGQVVGGLSGRTSLGLLFIDWFYLPPDLRGNGWGSQVLRMAEGEARQRGCRAGVLYTISFQAPDFYQRHGWEVFGQVPCDPLGTSRIFLSKSF